MAALVTKLCSPQDPRAQDPLYACNPITGRYILKSARIYQDLVHKGIISQGEPKPTKPTTTKPKRVESKPTKPKPKTVESKPTEPKTTKLKPVKPNLTKPKPPSIPRLESLLNAAAGDSDAEAI